MKALQNVHEALIAFASGAFGFFGVVKSWQEQTEWALRIALLLLSITATALGIWLAIRKGRGKQRPE